MLTSQGHRRRRFGRRGAPTALALGFVAALAVVPSAAQPQEAVRETLASGSAVGTGLFVTYSDNSNLVQGGTTPPPDVSFGHSTAGVDLTGNGSAVAALAYTPYVELFGAVNGLSPSDAPKIPAEEMSGATRASVQGQPPREDDASVTPDGPVRGGAMRTRLADGPAAEATSELAGLGAVEQLDVRSLSSRSTAAKADDAVLSEATYVLRGVDVGGVLRIDTVRLSVRAHADGATGVAEASVAVEGATVNDVPVRITDQGIEADDQVLPVTAAALADSLEQAGIRVVAPAERAVEPGGARSVASASGPTLELTGGQNNERVVVMLGRAVAASSLVAGSGRPSTSGGTPGASGGPAAPVAGRTGDRVEPAPSTFDAAPPAPAPAVPPAPSPRTAPPATGTRAVTDLGQLTLSGGEAPSRMEGLYVALALATVAAVVGPYAWTLARGRAAAVALPTERVRGRRI